MSRSKTAGRTPGLSVGKGMRVSSGYGGGRGRRTAPAFAAEQVLERVVETAQGVKLRQSGEAFDDGQLFALSCCADWIRWEMEFASRVLGTLWRGRVLRHFDTDRMIGWTAAKRPARR